MSLDFACWRPQKARAPSGRIPAASRALFQAGLCPASPLQHHPCARCLCRHKKTLKRRPFCFVTFANKEDAERALAESGLEIAGVPIKNLTMVEDR